MTGDIPLFNISNTCTRSIYHCAVAPHSDGVLNKTKSIRTQISISISICDDRRQIIIDLTCLFLARHTSDTERRYLQNLRKKTASTQNIVDFHWDSGLMRPYCALFFGIGENFHTQNDIHMTTTIFYIFVSQGISLCQENYTKIRPNSLHFVTLRSETFGVLMVDKLSHTELELAGRGRQSGAAR